MLFNVMDYFKNLSIQADFYTVVKVIAAQKVGSAHSKIENTTVCFRKAVSSYARYN